VSAAFLNIVIGLATSVLSGGSVWLWQHAKNARLLRRRAAFFGLEPGGQCLIIMNNKAGLAGSAHHDDVQAMIEVATLASGVGSSVSLESCDEFRGSNADRTEFCIGGPTGGSNPRTGGHLASCLPGVTLCGYHPRRRDSMAIVVGDQSFHRDRGNDEYALAAKFTPPGSSRPVILISGQTAITNRAAIGFLKREYRGLAKTLASTDRFCVVIRARSIGTYGHQAAELAADVTSAAFAGYTPGTSSARPSDPSQDPGVRPRP
jgi:hypothetical protein